MGSWYSPGASVTVSKGDKTGFPVKSSSCMVHVLPAAAAAAAVALSSESPVCSCSGKTPLSWTRTSTSTAEIRLCDKFTMRNAGMRRSMGGTTTSLLLFAISVCKAAQSDSEAGSSVNLLLFTAKYSKLAKLPMEAGIFSKLFDLQNEYYLLGKRGKLVRSSHCTSNFLNFTRDATSLGSSCSSFPSRASSSNWPSWAISLGMVRILFPDSLKVLRFVR